MILDFSRCRKVWVPDDSEAGGFWNPVFEHVKEAVRKIVVSPYMLLADDMGLSKTASAIISAQFLHDAGLIDQVIVVAPAAVRPKVWFDQDLGQLHEQAFDDKRIVAIDYHARVRTWERGPREAHPLTFYITNYEYIRSAANLVALLPYATTKTMLILDESSAVRGYDSKQTEACMILRWRCNARRRPVLGAARCGRVLEMNGTPVAESPMDLFSQGNLLHPSILDCRYVTHYKARYAVQVPVLGAGGRVLTDPRGQPIRKIDGWTNLDDLQRRLAPYVLRREARSLGIDFALPAVGLEVTLTPTTWRHYCDMRDEMVVWLKSGVATSATAAIKTIRLAQITSGFLGGVEDANIGEPDEGLFDQFDLPGSFLDGLRPNEEGKRALMEQHRHFENVLREESSKIQAIGREKLDFALEWHAELLRRRPDLKLLTWCRFVPELRRYLDEVKKFGHPVGTACGEKVFAGDHSQKSEREHALRLLHPKTAPAGPATVGATQGTGAIGLNFTACRTVLDMSYDFSPWKKRQGDARVNRPGQTGPVSFFYLIAVGPRGQKTIDHHIMLARLGKMQVNDLTMSGWVKMLKEE